MICGATNKSIFSDTVGMRGNMTGVPIEGLEGRVLLAYGGAVTARVEDGWLIVQGDGAANGVIIEFRDWSGQYWFHRIGDTTINGDRGTFVNGPAKGVRVRLGEGGDELRLQKLGAVPGEAAVPAEIAAPAFALDIDLGSGDDTFDAEECVLTGRLAIAAGSGHDRIAVRDSRVGMALSILGGSGHDAVELLDTYVGGKLEVDDRAGRAWVGLEGVNVAGRTTVRTGALGDSIILRDTALGQRTRVTTLDGNDHVVVRNTTFATSALIDDGAGADLMDREVTLAWDFRHAAQGWEAGFAELILQNGQIPYEGWDLRAGITPLPAETGWGGTGFLVTGNNFSDDLFMYLNREISTVEGLLPQTPYRLSFDLSFATSVPSGSGAQIPVGLWLGGAPREPAVTAVDGFLVLNVDKTGGEVSGAGNIENGLDILELGQDAYAFRVVRRQHTRARAITTDEQGRIWLLVGTDSGFEGPTTVYFVKVEVRLTPLLG